jgi:hypothetical protein
MGYPKPIAIVSSEDKERWYAERGRGVTKTDVTRLVSGTLAAKRAVHNDKTGATPKFKGNDATERGHAFEAGIAAWVEEHYGIPASGILYAHGGDRRYLATPDTFLWDDGEGAFVEIKTTTEDWSNGLPQKIIDDVLWQRFVLGAGWSAVAWQRFDEDGMPLTIEPQLVEVPFDHVRHIQLIDAADDYLDWVKAGCPDEDSDIPPHVRDAVEQNIAAKREIERTEQVVRDWIAETPGAAENGLKKTATVGSIAFSITKSTEFDKEKAIEEAPDTIAAYIELTKKHRKPKTGTRLVIAPPTAKTTEEQEAA